MSDPKRQSEILFYSTPDGEIRVEVTFEDETFWLTQKKMSELFGVGVPTINHHLREIFNSNELNEMATIRKSRIVQTEGSREVAREVEFYNLDAIIAVGYRVNSARRPSFAFGRQVFSVSSSSRDSSWMTSA